MPKFEHAKALRRKIELEIKAREYEEQKPPRELKKIPFKASKINYYLAIQTRAKCISGENSKYTPMDGVCCLNQPSSDTYF